MNNITTATTATSEDALVGPTTTNDVERDEFGNYRTDSGRLMVAEQERIDGRRLHYRLTTRQEQAVAQAYADGQQTIKSIATDYGIGHETVRRIATSHGVPMRMPALSAPKLQFNPRDALAMRKAGFSIAKIADCLGVTPTALGSFFARTPNAKIPFAEAIKRRKACMDDKSQALT